MIIGYHASHEQFSPSELLGLTLKAEAAGFNGILSSDHFHPWGEAQGHSGLVWSWLGAAMHATKLSFGVVTAPVKRYNPAIVAQGAATLADMFPGRFWLAVGSGQYLSEGITGEGWPPKEERNLRLQEAAGVMRSLWSGRVTTHRGRVTVEEARIYDAPSRPPLMVAAALSPQTAEFVGGWADGLITTSRPSEDLKGMVEAFRRGGGGGKPLFLKVQVSYARDVEVALKGAWEQWRTNVFPDIVSTDMRTPEQFDAAAAYVRPEDVSKRALISTDPEVYIQRIEQYKAMGFERIYLHNVARSQEEFIEDFGREVIPAVLGG